MRVYMSVSVSVSVSVPLPVRVRVRLRVYAYVDCMRATHVCTHRWPVSVPGHAHLQGNARCMYCRSSTVQGERDPPK